MTNQPAHLNDDSPIDPTDLQHFGIYTAEALDTLAKQRREWCVQGLLMADTRNILVGDSGLGKTALVAQLAMCVASGKDFLGHKVRRGRVLLVDYESTPGALVTMLNSLALHLDLGRVPGNLYTSSSDWEHVDGDLFKRIAKLKPDLIVVDPLRLAFPGISGNKPDPCVEAFEAMKKAGGTWLAVHHRRKENKAQRTVPLLEAPREWLQESAGSFAIINHSDTRLGIAPSKTEAVDIELAGFIRGCGLTAPIYIRRVMSDEGQPIGYVQAQGLDLLSPKHRSIYDNLQDNFRFTDVQAATRSGSIATAFIDHCRQLGVVRFRLREDPKSGYTKTGGLGGETGVTGTEGEKN